MTNNLKGVVTLKSVISDALIDLGPQGDIGNYFRYLSFAVRILKELNMFHMRIANTVKLPMSDIYTVELPDDYLAFLSLSIPVNGQEWTFTKNDKLIIPESENCGILTLDALEGENIGLGTGENMYTYGLPGGRNDYYYRIDFPNNRIIINGFMRSTVTLTYIGTGIKISETTMVPKIAEEALIAGIHMLAYRHDRSYSMTEKMDKKNIYDEEIEKLRMIQGPTIDEIYDAIYETIYQSAKR